MESIYDPSWPFRANEYLGSRHLNYGYWSLKKGENQVEEGSIEQAYRQSHCRMISELLEFIQFQPHPSCIPDLSSTGLSSSRPSSNDIKRHVKTMDEWYDHYVFVACGSGHELQLFTELHPCTEKIKITGIELVPSQVAQAQLLFSPHDTIDSQSSDRTRVSHYNVSVIQGDACSLNRLIPSSPPVSLILCLDSAYHFTNRIDFLKQSFQLLSHPINQSKKDKIKRLGLVDFTFTWPNLAFFLPSLFALFSSIPVENQITPDTYHSTLKSLGFQTVSMKDCSSHVFVGFKRHVWRCWKVKGSWIQIHSWFPLFLIAFLLESMWRLQILQCFMISATI